MYYRTVIARGEHVSYHRQRRGGRTHIEGVDDYRRVTHGGAPAVAVHVVVVGAVVVGRVCPPCKTVVLGHAPAEVGMRIVAFKTQVACRTVDVSSVAVV